MLTLALTALLLVTASCSDEEQGEAGTEYLDQAIRLVLRGQYHFTVYDIPAIMDGRASERADYGIDIDDVDYVIDGGGLRGDLSEIEWTILGGDIDFDAIRNTLSGRGYETRDHAGGGLWHTSRDTEYIGLLPNRQIILIPHWGAGG